MVAVHCQRSVVEPFWVVLSYTCSVSSREILEGNWVKHNVSNMALTNSLSLCLESSCGFLHSLSSSPGKFIDVHMAISLPLSNPAHMVLSYSGLAWPSHLKSQLHPLFLILLSLNSALLSLSHFWNELSDANDVLMNRNKVVRKTTRWSPGCHRNHSGPWIFIFHRLHCLCVQWRSTDWYWGSPS